jgi:hypothetical protein
MSRGLRWLSLLAVFAFVWLAAGSVNDVSALTPGPVPNGFGTTHAAPASTYDASASPAHATSRHVSPSAVLSAAIRASRTSREDTARTRDFGVAVEDVTSSLSYTTKITKAMGPRGWTEESVADTVKNPAQTHSVWDFTTGDKQPATAYVQHGGGYVVVNDATGEIVQVSDLGSSSWKPVWDDPRFQR